MHSGHLNHCHQRNRPGRDRKKWEEGKREGEERERKGT